MGEQDNKAEVKGNPTAERMDSVLEHFESRRGNLPSDFMILGHVVKSGLESGQTQEDLTRDGSIGLVMLTERYSDFEDRELLAQAIHNKYHSREWEEEYDAAYERFEKSQGHDPYFKKMQEEIQLADNLVDFITGVNTKMIGKLPEIKQQQGLQKMADFRKKVQETRQKLTENLRPAVMEQFSKAEVKIQGANGKIEKFPMRGYLENKLTKLTIAEEDDPDNLNLRDAIQQALDLFGPQFVAEFSQGAANIILDSLEKELKKAWEEQHLLETAKNTQELLPSQKKTLELELPLKIKVLTKMKHYLRFASQELRELGL